MAKANTVLFGLVQKVHIAVAQCGLDDDTYRDYLEKHTGKRSSKSCTIAELETVLRAFKADYGWMPKPRSKRAEAASDQQAKIRALWTSLAALGVLNNPHDTGLLWFIKRVMKNKRVVEIEALRFLSPSESSSVIEALKGWLEREGVEWNPPAHVSTDKFFQADRAPVIHVLWSRYLEAHPDAAERGLLGFACSRLEIADWEAREFPKVGAEECDRLIKIFASELHAAGRGNVTAFPGARHG